MQSHVDCGRVQDPYSLRCMPQVHGASRNAWLHLKELTETELNSVTDNPIVFDADYTVSGGNFHGQPLALPLDYNCFAAAEIGNISDRRCYLLLEGKWGLPLLLMNNVGWLRKTRHCVSLRAQTVFPHHWDRRIMSAWAASADGN
jgi:histidine ammonia-lyase